MTYLETARRIRPIALATNLTVVNQLRNLVYCSPVAPVYVYERLPCMGIWCGNVSSSNQPLNLNICRGRWDVGGEGESLRPRDVESRLSTTFSTWTDHR